MAHSYIYAKINSKMERAVAIPDGALRLFMYFFNELAEPKVRPNSLESEICGHYKIELLEVHTSYIEVMLQKISEDSHLRDWYLQMLSQLEIRLDDFGGYIDNNYLNQVPELVIGYAPGVNVFTRPVEVSVIKSLINDIYWVLDEGGHIPSGQYKWFEENI